MDVTFTAFDLTFCADLAYTPPQPGFISGPPEDCYPDEPSEIEFYTLTYKGKDATFLLDSPTLAETLYEAAGIAADKAYYA